MFQEMIQTWVTYEVVKVIFLFGLNPELKTTIKEVAPQIQTYIQYIKDPEESTYETGRNSAQKIIKQNTALILFFKMQIC